MDPITSALVDEFAQSSSLENLTASQKFEHFCAFSIVSNRYSEEFETEDLVVGDGGDLNVDAFAVKVNGRLASDADFVDDVLAVNGYLDVEFIIIQAKTSSNFDGAAIIALGDNLKHQIFAETQTMPFNSDVARLIEIKERIFANAAKLRGNPTLRIFYACTGNWNNDNYLVAAINQKKTDLENTNLFSEVQYQPIGARSIQELFRQTRTSIVRELVFSNQVTLPAIDGVEAAYLGYLPYSEFLKLITDEDGEIIKSVFVDNVRDFQGQNPVNEDIAETIRQGEFDQFALRNNGVTVVAREIKVTSNRYTLVDYQIVNGCQTSHVLFQNSDNVDDNLLVPIKVIHTTNEEVSQAVTKSTNRQTKVEESDLLALTTFQRDLEDYYSNQPPEYRLYYERRTKQYANRNDIERGRIVPISMQLKSFASMFIELPNQASRYQGTLMRSVGSQVFRENHRPEPYFLSSLALYRFEVAIRRLPIEQRDIRPFRFYLLLAFRYLYEDRTFESASKRSAEAYCEGLKQHLVNHDVAKPAFDACEDVVRTAIAELGLTMDRDSAKSRPLIDKVRQISQQRNTART
ncbi:AIPR family protein [Marimonas arenosa]|nr:AIPR family protein [Marimonas arenosa]